MMKKTLCVAAALVFAAAGAASLSDGRFSLIANADDDYASTPPKIDQNDGPAGAGNYHFEEDPNAKFDDGSEETELPPIDIGDEIVASGKCGDTLEWKVSKNGVLTISGTGKMYSYDFNSRAPWKDFNVTSIVIEEGAETIGDWAFDGLADVTSVTLPSTLKKIGLGSFAGCTGLDGVTFPDGLLNIGPVAFEDCVNIKKVTIPNSVTGIGENAFGYYWDDAAQSDLKYPGLTIYCYSLSTGLKYAANDDNQFDFVLLDANEYVLGEITGEPGVNNDDVIACQQLGAKWRVPGVDPRTADVCTDGEIDNDDCILLQQKGAKWRVTFGKQY